MKRLATLPLVLTVAAITILAGVIAANAVDLPEEFPFLSSGGGTVTGAITVTGAGTTDCVIFDDNGAQGCVRTADEAPNAVYVTGQTAWPGATVNTTGSNLILGAGQGRTAITAFTFANCATDTVTLTVDGTATVSTEGTHWTAATSDAATCSSLLTRLKTITGVSSTSSCSGEELRLIKSPNVGSISLAASDATCAVVTNGTDGGVRAVPYITSDAADPADAGYIRMGTGELIAMEASTPGTDLTIGGTSAGLVITAPATVFTGVPMYDTGGTGTARLWAVGVNENLSPTMQTVWASGANLSSPDVGLARQAAGVLRVSDSSTGLGDLWLDDLIAGTTGGTIDLTSGTDGALSFCNAAKGTCRTFTVDSDGILFSSGFAAANGVSSKSGSTYKWIANNSNVLHASDIPIAWSSTTSAQGSVDSGIARNAAGVVRVTNGSTGTGTLVAGTTSTKDARTTYGGAATDLTCSGGGSATLTATNLIPDGAFLLGVSTRITTALTGSTGFSVGDGSDADLYGVQAAATQGSTTSNADATATWGNPQLSAVSPVLTFSGGACTAGAIHVVAHFISIAAATSN
jgi:hypothetical protein